MLAWLLKKRQKDKIIGKINNQREEIEDPEKNKKELHKLLQNI